MEFPRVIIREKLLLKKEKIQNEMPWCQNGLLLLVEFLWIFSNFIQRVDHALDSLFCLSTSIDIQPFRIINELLKVFLWLSYDIQGK